MDTNDAIWISDAHGDTLAINEVFLNYTGYDALSQWIGFGEVFYSWFYENGTIFDNCGAHIEGL